jgi:CheY-like chemotaxis protein
MSSSENPRDKKTGYLGLDRDMPSPPPAETGPLESIIPWVVEFRIVGTTEILKAHLQDTIMLGRSDAVRGVRPDIDLDPFGGQEKGVSRRHAIILAKDNRVIVQDEGSANGTFINNQPLVPRQPYRLRDGDKLRLGQLELQTHFVIKPSINEQTLVGANMMQIPRIGNGERVLLLDDDEFVLRVISNVLERAGFTAALTRSSADAIGSIDEELPDIMILELLMSETTGLDVIRYLRGKAGDRHVPIMAITSATGGYRMGQALQEGVDMYLGKPVAVDELLTGISTMLNTLPGKKEENVPE